ncbi:flagellar protein FlaG [Marinitoga aeolica]|uniref:Flagellar protein FlaG n=1 Tax=Marinitoga aeolica TaxID=2809031 RepID=A0ABY8PN81_9BACT|nr:flagellar protein FlaG [Marinitoga aeolica]WGS64098.1 flagellar protein FlaG [Marinitoga aeolica]
MGEMNRINGDFSSFIDSLTKDVDISKKSGQKTTTKTNVNKNQEHQVSNNALDTRNLSKVIEEKLNKLKEIFKGEVKFEVNDDINMIIVKIVDKDSKKVIRQIPPETAVKMAEMLDKLEGIFLDERA